MLEPLPEGVRQSDRMAMVGWLAAAFAHDIGTPLTVVLGRAAVITDSRSDPPLIEASAKKIADNAQRIAQLTRRFVEFAGAASSPKRIALVPLIRTTIELMESMARKRKVRFELQPEEQKELTVEFETDQLQQLVADLLLNAVQSMPKGGTARITVERRDEQAVLVVEDEGPPIAAADQTRIFEPLYSCEGRPAGLALSVVREIAESHGGRATAESSGGTTRFTCLLPLIRREGGPA